MSNTDERGEDTEDRGRDPAIADEARTGARRTSWPESAADYTVLLVDDPAPNAVPYTHPTLPTNRIL